MRLHLKRLVLTVIVVVTGCVGQTDDASNISHDGATLHGTGTCDSGTCQYYFRIWPVEMGAAWAFSTPVRTLSGMPPNTTASLPGEPVSGLRPDTAYEFQVCGKEGNQAAFLCAGARGFRTLPPPQIPTFTSEFTPPNLVTLRWSTSGGTPGVPLHVYGTWHDPATGTFYKNVGFRTEHQNTAGLSFRVRFGHHRYVLALPTASGEVTRNVEVEVPGPASPNVPTRVLNLYAPLLTDTTLTWSNPSPGHFVTISRFQHTDRFQTPVGAASHTFTKAYLESLGQGSHRFDLATCRSMAGLTPKMSGSFCGARTVVVLEIGAAKFEGPRRVHVRTGGSATVSWTPTGQFAFLDVPSLWMLGLEVAGTSYTFQNLPAGIHDIRLTSCTLYPPTCAHLTNVAADVAGTLEYVAAPTSFFPVKVLPGTVLARIRTPDPALVEIRSPVEGFLHYIHVAEGETVSAGTLLHSIRTGDFEHIQLVVGDTPFERKDWRTDYAPWVSGRHIVPDYNHVSLGSTMPVLASADGNVWAGGEHAEGSLLHITGNFLSGYVLTPFAAPVLHKPQGERLLPVKPFALLNGTGSSVTKQEIVIEAGPHVWIINGGDQRPHDTPDYNRLLRFDRRAKDLHTTPHDDRFCVFHVPFDGANVMGIAWDEAAGRIWYVESRKPKNATPVLAWFKPSELQCENFLDYSDAGAVAAASTRYCTSASQTHCIHTVPLTDWQDASRRLSWAAHVTFDTEAVWVAGFFSSSIARYDRASGRVDILPVPRGSGFSGIVGTGPWQLVSRGNHLYFTEFFDGDVVRLDKQRFASDPALCKALDTNRRNPCMSEIHASTELKELKIHGDRLYFAGYRDFGYIDLTAWTPGAIYGGLESLRDPERRRRGELLTGDMSIGPDATVVLNDYMGRQVYRLYPTAP